MAMKKTVTVSGETEPPPANNKSPQRIDLSGRVFGRWTVLSFARIDKCRNSMWTCKCDCGTVATVRSNKLRNGKSNGCHRCSAIDKRGDPYTRNAKRVWSGAYADCPFDLFMETTQQACHWCGREPERKAAYCVRRYSDSWNEKLNRHPFIYNGLDRIDNNLGHVRGNVWASCWRCNRMRSDLSVKEFEDAIEAVYLHMQTRRQLSKTG